MKPLEYHALMIKWKCQTLAVFWMFNGNLEDKDLVARGECPLLWHGLREHFWGPSWIYETTLQWEEQRRRLSCLVGEVFNGGWRI